MFKLIKSLFSRKKDRVSPDNFEKSKNIDLVLDSLFVEQEKKVKEIYDIVSVDGAIKSFKSYYNSFTKIEPLVFQLGKITENILLNLSQLISKIEGNIEYFEGLSEEQKAKESALNMVSVLKEMYSKMSNNKKNYLNFAEKFKKNIIQFQIETSKYFNEEVEIPSKLENLASQFIKIKSDFQGLREQYKSIRKFNVKYDSMRIPK